MFDSEFEEDDIRDAIIGNRVFITANEVAFIKDEAKKYTDVSP